MGNTTEDNTLTQKNNTIHPQLADRIQLLLSYAANDYKQLTVDLPTFQQAHTGRYLWLATVLFGANLTIYKELLEGGITIPFLQGAPTVFFYIGAVLSLLLQLIVFVMGVDTMRGKKPTAFPFGDYTDRVRDIWSVTPEKSEQMLINVLGSYQRSIKNQIEAGNQVGIRLKHMSLLILSSVFITILTVASCATVP
ncbi:hypothetical protein [Halodesulfovibrio aestuarii]|uniref:hypothetical protein n=1 Tax=Halodesulfovibrio aestuarii TaxID=126333 RepID=UPI0004264BF0